MKFMKIWILAVLMNCLLLMIGCVNTDTGQKLGPVGSPNFGAPQFSKPIGNQSAKYIEKADDYLISKFGKGLFESSITFDSAFLLNFSYWGGCKENIEQVGDGEKYIVQYRLDLSKDIILPKSWPTDAEVRVVYNHLGKVDCTYNVVDCVNHPELCPPYKISDYRVAMEALRSAYNRTPSRLSFEGYSNFNSGGGITPNESRFLWYFDDLSCGRHCAYSWAVYVDPQTGKILYTDNG